VAAGEYPNVTAATDALIQTRSTVLPDGELVAKYEEKYRHFQKLYPALKGLFTK
jgi:xylulokinase